MNNYVLTCCSTADLPSSYFEERKIPYVCFHYTIDGQEYPDDLGQTMSFSDFYGKIRGGAMPTTSQVNVDQFTTFFEPLLQQGKDILHVTLSSGISGVYNSACIAQQDLMEKYPDRKIIIVDSLCASSGYGLLMDMAADKRDTGASITELQSYIEEIKLNIHHWFFATDLTHFLRGGRISAASAIAGTLLNICPLMNVDDTGHLVPRRKIRGKKQVIREMFKCMQEHAENGADYSGKCFMSNSDCPEDARAVADLVEAAFPKLAAPVMINSIGTVIGSHTGVGTVALFFVGDKRQA